MSNFTPLQQVRTYCKYYDELERLVSKGYVMAKPECENGKLHCELPCPLLRITTEEAE